MATKSELQAMMDKVNNFETDLSTKRARMDSKLLDIQMNNQERLLAAKESREKEILAEALRLGLSNEQILSQFASDKTKEQVEQEKQARLAAVEAEYQARIAQESDPRKKKQLEKEYKEKYKQEQNLDKKVAELKKKQAQKQLRSNIDNAKKLMDEEHGMALFNKERQHEYMQKLMADNPGMTKAEAKAAIRGAQLEKILGGTLEDFAKKLADQGAKIAESQMAVDTRLQGLTTQRKWLGSYWQAINQDIGAAVGLSPFVKQETVIENLKTLVSQGIAFDVEQRAFLMTIKDSIATTFNAADSTLLKLVRIQQADTTAARLGMESALTSFLNNMYETTEYMSEQAASIREGLYEASALMGATEATAFEYQVQKWLGSLHSVGFSSTQGLGSALGKIASGDISGITEGGFGNLLVMAASQAGIPIETILAEGLDASETNRLLQTVVEYLGNIYKETKGSLVVTQQIASVYGVTASDLKAAANLSGSLSTISGTNLDYPSMIKQLNNMANTMFMRQSVAGMMNTLMENLSYTMAEAMGNNPILYTTYQIANMLDQVGGGINIPFINAMGFGVDLNTDIATLMKIGAMSGSVLQGLGKLVASLGTGGGFSGSGMLKAIGVTSGLSTTSRGTASGLLTTSGATVSESGYVGNESSEDVRNKTVSDASEESESQLAQAKEEEDDVKLKQVDEHIVAIYELLHDVVLGSSSLNVRFDSSISFN